MNCFLVGDIGGTNTRIGVVEQGKKIKLLDVFECKSAEIKDATIFIQAQINRIQKNKKYKITECCLGVAGTVVNNTVLQSKINVVFEGNKIQKNCKLKRILLINDFECLGFALNVLSSADIKVIQSGSVEKQGIKCVLGAGTGFGKTIAYSTGKEYITIPSEGGNADFSFFTNPEIDLCNFICKMKSMNRLSSEEVVSGRGLEAIYQFYQKTIFSNAPAQLSAEKISETKVTNACSKKTLEQFSLFYAKVCRNFALETLPFGGMFIGGGIGLKNPYLFNEKFLEEFRNHDDADYANILRRIPLYLITNPRASLLGSAFALQKKVKK